MEKIIRGTTPYLILDFSEETSFDISEITAAVLTIRTGSKKKEVFLKDLIVDIDAETISYHFSQEDTLGFRTGDTVHIKVDVMVGDNRYRVFTACQEAVDTDYEEVLKCQISG